MNRLIKAIGSTILLVACLHLAILVPYALLNRQWHLLNLFNILDLELLVPNMSYSTASYVASVVICGALITFFWLRQPKE